MNPLNNRFPPPFFYNGSCPPPNPGVVPTAFNRPPPPFPPPNVRLPPPGYNGYNTGIHNNNQIRPNGFHQNNFLSNNNPIHSNGFHQPNLNNNQVRPNGFHHQVLNPNNNQNLFSCPPPPINQPPPPVPPRPSFTPDTVFSPPPNNNMVHTHQEGFPFSNNQRHSSQSQHGSPARGARGGGRGRGDWRGRGRGGFPNSQQNQGKKKKEKVDKRDLPENNAFFCDTCDRGFKTQEKYQEHVDGHMKCSYKGCPFIAAPKLVHLHIALQHRTGLAKKVWSMESEEDINKWREERKRKFPTAANIAKKKEEEAQRIARGEVLQNKDFSSRGRGQDRGRGGRGKRRGQNRRGRGRGGRFHPGSGDSFAEENKKVGDGEDGGDSDDDAPTEVAIVHSKTPDNAKEVKIKDSKHEEIEASGEIAQIEKPEPHGKKSVLEAGTPNTTSLGLLASYDYSSSDEDEEKEVVADIENLHKPETQAPDMETPLEAQLQPSPAKRPRLLPNPFLSQNLSSQSESEHEPSEILSSSAKEEQRDCNLLGSSKASTSESESNLKDKEASSKSPNKFQLHNSCEGYNSTVESEHVKPAKLRTIGNHAESKNGDRKKCDNEITNDEVEPTNPGAESAEKNFSPQKNLSEDVETKEDEESEHGSKGFKRARKGRQQTKRQNPGRKATNPHTYTLLEKLLASDIRRERNKILQCVHYIVKNKFFDPILETDATSPTDL